MLGMIEHLSWQKFNLSRFPFNTLLSIRSYAFCVHFFLASTWTVCRFLSLHFISFLFCFSEVRFENFSDLGYSTSGHPFFCISASVFITVCPSNPPILDPKTVHKMLSGHQERRLFPENCHVLLFAKFDNLFRIHIHKHKTRSLVICWL